MFEEVFDGEALSGGEESVERECGVVEVELVEREGLLEVGVTYMGESGAEEQVMEGVAGLEPGIGEESCGQA